MALKINSASGSITLTAEDGSGNADVTIPRDGIVSDLSDLSITATATELNYVDGVTSNIQTQLDAKGTVSTLADLSITATATELNYVDGVTSNIQTQLDGKGTVSTLADLSVTATAIELNLLDGVTATTAELNYIDGVTSNIQTQLDQKAASLTDLSVTAAAAELNILDGATLTTTELNYVDGVTSAIQTQIDGKLATTLKGAANGLAELDGSGLVPTSQLPSYVDDVLEYPNASSFPGTGETGKIYVALDTNDIYRWSGSAYVKVSDAVSTSDQATALATARTISLTGDVTGSTSFDGSANVSITATIADDSHNHVISNVDGLQTALDAKAPLASPTFTGTVTFPAGQTFDGRDVSADGSKLDGIAAGAEVNQNAFSTVAVSGQTSVAADGKTDTLTLAAGSNVTITTNATTDTVTIAATNTNTTYSAGGGLSLSGTTFSHSDTSSQGSLTALTGANVISDIDVDTYGHVTSMSTRALTLANLGYTGETNATADQTASEILTAIKTVDGSGSGLDADTVDGIQGANLLRSDTSDTMSGTLTALGVTVNGTLDIEEVHEKVTTVTSTSGTFNYNTQNEGIVYATANQTANRTINFGNVNSTLSIGQSVTCTFMATQGSTAYYLNAYQVDGTAVTPKWSGGSAPSAGNASGIDVYTFTIIKTANATFTVLASMTQYA